MKLRKTILLLDNDKGVLASTSALLMLQGYIVFTAENINQALEMLKNERIYLVVVDARLLDEYDSTDISGLKFSSKLSPEISKIILTAYLTPEISRQALTMHSEKTFPADDVISKQAGPGALLEAVNHSFEKIISQINLDSLEIEFNSEFSLEALMKPIAEDFPRLTEDEVEELLRRLFRQENRIKIYYLPPGRGGAGVALVKPFYGEMEGAITVMKFGLTTIIEREIDRYKKYVQPFVQPYSTVLLGEPVHTHHLAACRLLFVGSTKDHLLDFNTFYGNTANLDTDLRQVIRNIFFQTCRIWYKGKRKWQKREDGSLGLAMEEQLWSDSAGFHEELQRTLKDLVNGESFHNVTFQRFGSSIRALIDGGEEKLHNPLYMITSSHERLPIPAFASITHGDLNGHNLFVDDKKLTWLIDFYKTGWGPALRDAAELESAIKFQLVESDNLPKLLAFENAILAPSTFSEEVQLRSQIQKSGEFQRALNTIQCIREVASEIGETNSMDEYYAILMYYALKMMTWKGVSSTDKQRRRTRQRHALYSAAVISGKLFYDKNKEEKHIL